MSIVEFVENEVLDDVAEENTVSLSGDTWVFNKVGVLADDWIGCVDVDGTLLADVDGTLLADVDGTLLADVDGTLLADVDGTLLADVDGTLLADVDGTLPADVDGILLADVDGTLLADVDGTLLADVDGTLLADVDGTLLADVDGTLLANVDGTLLADVNGRASCVPNNETVNKAIRPIHTTWNCTGWALSSMWCHFEYSVASFLFLLAVVLQLVIVYTMFIRNIYIRKLLCFLFCFLFCILFSFCSGIASNSDRGFIGSSSG